MAGLLLGASFLTLAAQFLQDIVNDAIWPVMVVDLLLLLGLYWVAIHSRRLWPLWVTGFHLITMTTHLAVLLAPNFAIRVYIGLATLWSIPMLLVILVGVTLDRQAGLSDHDTA